MKNSKIFFATLIAVLVSFMSNLTAQTEISLNLKPGEKAQMTLNAPTSNLVVFRFQADEATQKSIEDMFSAGETSPPERVKINDRRPLRVQLSNSKRTWQAEAELDPLAYSFNLPNGLKEAATLSIENISKSTLTGKGRLDQLNAADLKVKKEQAANARMAAAMKEVQNTDAVYFIQTMFRRHLEGYPGGKGDIDTEFEKNLQESGVSNETIEMLVGNMRQFEGEVKAKVKNKKLLSEVKTSGTVSTQKMKQSGIAPAANDAPQGGVGSSFTDQFKYTMSFMGIKSHRCADDVGWEPFECDAEEGWVSYFAVGQGLFSVGNSNYFSGMIKNSERILTKTVFSNKKLTGTVIFLYQVIEDDPGGPSKEQVTSAFASALNASVQAYGGNYTAIAGAVFDVVSVVQNWMGGDDDLYPVYINIIDSQKLHTYSTGTANPPTNVSLFNSEGIYRNQLTIQVPRIKTGNTLQWSLAYRLQGIKG